MTTSNVVIDLKLVKEQLSYFSKRWRKKADNLEPHMEELETYGYVFNSFARSLDLSIEEFQSLIDSI